jgi:hypothetical protein
MTASNAWAEFANRYRSSRINPRLWRRCRSTSQCLDIDLPRQFSGGNSYFLQLFGKMFAGISPTGGEKWVRFVYPACRSAPIKRACDQGARQARAFFWCRFRN